MRSPMASSRSPETPPSDPRLKRFRSRPSGPRTPPDPSRSPPPNSGYFLLNKISELRRQIYCVSVDAILFSETFDLAKVIKVTGIAMNADVSSVTRKKSPKVYKTCPKL